MDIGAYFSILTALVAGEHALQPSDVSGLIVRKNHSPELVGFDPASELPTFNAPNEIIFIIHGWMEDRNVSWYNPLTKALLKQNEENIIVQVDWSKGSKMQREAAVKNNIPAGIIIGTFIKNLTEKNDISLSKIHLIGFSQGGQISGFAGKTLKALSNKKIGRITALDPSGRSYNDKPYDDRLNPDDAEAVAVIHTDTVKIGFKDPCGTVDLFVKGRTYPQPGCPEKIDPIDFIFCSHFRAPTYLIEGVDKNKLIGTKCESYQKFEKGLCSGNETLNFVGEISPADKGVYYVKTRSRPPFFE